MKALLLTAAALMACAGSMFAQFSMGLPPLYHWEIGVNGGLCAHTRPLGPADPYQGTRTDVVHDYSVRLNYYFSERWMIALDLGDRKWESFATWSLPGAFGQNLKSYEMEFLIADHAYTESIHMNYIIPFYTRFMGYNKSNVYFGVMGGLVTTVNDGSIGYSRYNASSADSGMRYITSYHYGFGVGYTFGAQVGLTYYIIPRLGLNVEVAARYADVGTNDSKYAAKNSRFNLLYFPETVGLRWRF